MTIAITITVIAYLDNLHISPLLINSRSPRTTTATQITKTAR